MDRSENIADLAAALCKAQAAVEGAKKSSAAVIPNQKPRKYADISAVWDACRKALTGNGLSVSQLPQPAEPGHLCLETVLLHSSGQYIASMLTMPIGKQDPQGFGSALTYARRYSLAAIVGITQEDDDAEYAHKALGQRRTAPNEATPLPADPDAEKAANGHVAARPAGSTADAVEQRQRKAGLIHFKEWMTENEVAKEESYDFLTWALDRDTDPVTSWTQLTGADWGKANHEVRTLQLGGIKAIQDAYRERIEAAQVGQWEASVAEQEKSQAPV